MATAAYLRVSTEDQNLARQEEITIGKDKVFREKASAKNAQRPELEKLLSWAREGDDIYVFSIDRLARNVVDLQGLIQQLTQAGATIHFQKEHLTFDPEGSGPTATLLLQVMGAIAEFERAIMLERQREGIAAARQAGKYKGRKKRLTPEQEATIREALIGPLTAGEQRPTMTTLAKKYGVGRATIHRALTAGRGAATTTQTDEAAA